MLRLFAAVLAAWLAAGTAAQAAVITSSPTLPPLGVGFTLGSGGSCFPAVNVCAVPGVLTFTSIASSGFNSGGQDIVANATLTAQITMPAQPPIPVTLTGTLEEEVLGRMPTDVTGNWPTQLLSVDLSGPVLGHTLSLGLDSSHTSTGGASVDALPSQEDLFRVDSFFDVFVELSFDLNPPPSPPLTTTRGPIHIALIPEPDGLALLAVPLLWLAVRRRYG
jgi:hypothetical protein